MTLRNCLHAGGLFGILFFTLSAHAELGVDTHIQESGEVRIEVDRQVFEEFSRMFALGYPPATVMMHAVSTGMSINDILYIAVKSDVSRAQEFYDTADSLLPALPGWVCQVQDDERYTRTLEGSDVVPDPSIREVAQVFFDDNRRLVPFPKWPDGDVHMSVPVSELADLVTEEQWYIAGGDDGTPRSVPNRPVFVSLYRHNQEIIVDSGFARIRQAREQGIDRLPVVLVYNDRMHRSISNYEAGVTVGELAEDFYVEGLQLTAVPEWQVGDHHKTASPEELLEVVDAPERDDVAEERWQAVEQKLRANGLRLNRPLLLTLVRSGQGNAWVDRPLTLSVASELDMHSLPVVFFYHRLDRRPCGQTSSCEDMLCEAATAAGASESVCGSDAGQTTAGNTNDSGSGGSDPSGANPSLAGGIDPRLYEGLSYTQNQCPS